MGNLRHDRMTTPAWLGAEALSRVSAEFQWRLCMLLFIVRDSVVRVQEKSRGRLLSFLARISSTYLTKWSKHHEVALRRLAIWRHFNWRRVTLQASDLIVCSSIYAPHLVLLRHVIRWRQCPSPRPPKRLYNFTWRTSDRFLYPMS